MRAWRALVVCALLLAGLLVAPAQKAYACSCAVSDVAQFLERADVVFTGTVGERRRDGDEPAGGPRSRFTVQVDEVYKGAVRERTFVRSGTQQASCGADLRPGVTVVIYGRRDAQGLVTTSLCDGSRPPERGELERLRSLAGQPSSASSGSDPDPPLAPPHLWAELTGGDGRPGTAAAGGAVLLLVAGVWLVRRSRRGGASRRTGAPRRR
ncbi:hypothetical protein [Barrientosiimonas humi]|uniref:hypothetical protein n=1 Tax=Barrientosiimonas humi TaxID=999931 RepID=UPI00370D0B1E